MIGWDAADWEIIDHLIADGKMPTLKRFLESGVRANLATLSPTLSPMLWTSIATGKRAYDHGIYGFVESVPGDDSVVPIRSTSRQCKAVWNVLNEAGLKTNVVNWWPSHPAEVLDGVCVSNKYHNAPPTYGDAWPIDSAVFSPANLKEQLKDLRVHPAELGLAHIQPFIPESAKLDPESDPILKSVIRILAHCSSIHNVATWLLENSDWDFMAIYQDALDHFSHLAMKYHPPQLPGVNDEEFKVYKNIISAAYQFHDMMLERLLELAGKDCDVILISDHGFHSGKARITELPDIPAAPALEHRRFGIFAASGPSFKPSSEIYGASLLDITPTLLHHFDLPVGNDMEGQVLLEIFRSSKAISQIDSWELTAKQAKFQDEGSSSDAEVLQQLEALGYVSLPKAEKGEYVRRELLYNRSISLLEGGRYELVTKELSPEWEKNSELRMGLVLAQALRYTGEHDRWAVVLEQLNERFPGNGAVMFQKGMLCLSNNAYDEALNWFVQLEQAGLNSAQLYTEIARVYLVKSSYSKAEEFFSKALQIDPENCPALTGNAQVLMELGKEEDALKLLEKTLSLQFFQPQAHFLLAQISFEKGQEEVAQKALQICLKQAPKHHAALNLLASMNGESGKSQKEIIIVTGWPRSGTSMMMQMLEASGIELYSDAERAPDKFNPGGYKEHRSVLSIGKDNKWISDVRGKCVKIVLPLLRYLPHDEKYKLIVMKRALTEVVVSQEVMKGRSKEEVMKNFPFQTAVNLQKEEDRLLRWINMQPNMSYIEIEMDDCIKEPKRLIQVLSEYLELQLDAEKSGVIPRDAVRNIKLGE